MGEGANLVLAGVVGRFLFRVVFGAPEVAEMAYCLCGIEVGADGLRVASRGRRADFCCEKLRLVTGLPDLRQVSHIHGLDPRVVGTVLRERVFNIEW